jgi:uncharacterized damage-inducible protein DinB
MGAVPIGAAGRPGAAVPPLPPEDHVCPQCGFAYPGVAPEGVPPDLARVTGQVRAAVARLPDDALRRRPAEGGWSVLEYACHLRDVYVTSTIRLHRAVTEDLPVLEPMLNDLRARRFRYNERDVGAVLAELAAAVAGFSDEVARVRPEDWDRRVTRLPGEVRSARWLARHALHEGRHHLLDITARSASG